MTPILIDSLDDDRLSPYRNLKDRELARDGDRFVAESEAVVRRLLASRYPVESVLTARRRADALAPLAASGIPMYVVPDAELHRVIGYRFHSGALAVGRRGVLPAIDDLLPDVAEPSTIVVCPELSNADNLGAIVRICAGLGVGALLLGERCCDPFYRIAIRVSMGTVFSLPIARSSDVLADLKRLRSTHRYVTAGAILDDEAEPLHTVGRPHRTAVLFGNEAQGLTPAELGQCDRRVTIPMYHNTDSLNVAVAAGIFLYHFAHAPPTPAVPRP